LISPASEFAGEIVRNTDNQRLFCGFRASARRWQYTVAGNGLDHINFISGILQAVRVIR
jgi:hypothetical protein